MWKPLMVSHHLAKFACNRHGGSRDIMFLDAEEEESRSSCYNPPLRAISKVHDLKADGSQYL